MGRQLWWRVRAFAALAVVAAIVYVILRELTGAL